MMFKSKLSFMKISQRVSDLLSGQFSIVKFSKGHNFVKNISGVTNLALCTSSDDALNLYQVSGKYLKGF